MPGKVTGIQGNRFHWKAEFLFLHGEPFQVRFGIVDIAGRDIRIGDEIVFCIHRPVVEIEKPLRLLIPHEKAAIRIRHTLPGQGEFAFRLR